MSVKVEHKNPKWVEKFKLRVDSQTKKEVAIGYPTGEGGITAPHYENGASILEVAIYNNFGTATIPRRPFMENASPKLQEMWKDLLASAQKRVNTGEISVETVLKAASLKGESVVRTEIDAITDPPNSPETIARKKSSKPLIDSGDMRKYVKGVVRGKTT